MKKNKKLSQLNDAPLTQPQNRTERFLAKIAKLADTAPADTRTRLERYLAAIVQSTAQAGIISADTETTVEGILFGNSTTGKVEGIVPEMSAEDVADYLEAVEEAVTAGGLVNSSQLNKWHSNPNLLDNNYFAGGGSQQGGGQFPINQRGQTSYSGVGYTIDRWKSTVEGAIINSNGILIPPNTMFGQIIENQNQILANKQLTFSALLADGTLVSGTNTVDFTSDVIFNDNGNVQVVYWHNGGSWFSVFNKPSNQSSITIVAVKLELGNRQTLAHQENGVWILNEIPNFQQELARCQRYQITSENMYYAGRVIGEHDARFTVPSPVTMRSTPRIEVAALGGMGTIDGGTPITELAVVGKSSQGILINAKTTSLLAGNTPITVVDSNFLLDANL